MSLSCLSVALVGTFAYLVYHYFTRNFNHWRKRKVEGPRPKLFFGNFKDSTTEKRCIAYEIDDIYKTYKNTEDFVGVFNATAPQLLILNPELAKKIEISDFNSFSDNEASDWNKGLNNFLLSDHPFTLTGQKWKEKRSELTPSLTPAKIKSYYPVIKSVCSKLTNHIKEHEQEFQKHFDATDLLLKFTGEIICDIAWGLEAGAFKSYGQCDFIKACHSLVDDFYEALGKHFMITSIPVLKKFMKIQFFKEETSKFFRNFTRLALESRMKGENRNDFLQFLIGVQEKKGITHDQFVGSQLILVFDGYDTTAVITAHVLLSIARYKNIQSRLRQLINELVEDDGFLDCDALQNLSYLDNIVNETLRIFTPVASGLWKYCTKPYELKGPKGKTVILKPKDLIVLPTYSFHMNSDFYDEPEKFNPDRFNEENGGVRKFKDAGVFAPFGAGPRICIGMKLALTLCKSAVVELVRNFEIELHEKTRRDNQCSPKSFMMKLDGGIHLKLKSL